MPGYHVTWEIDIDADSPRDAALKALEIQRDPSSLAITFDVIHDDENLDRMRMGLALGEAVRVDLGDEDNVGDDLCDTCMSSGVVVSHTKDGKTVCVACAELEDENE